MKLTRIGLAAVAVLAALALVTLLPTHDAAAAPGGNKPDKAKVVELICKPGWRGSAGGSYGGVGFSLGCDNGRARTALDGTVDTTYSVRMGVESASGAVDCFFQGDAVTVNERCAEVALRIR